MSLNVEWIASILLVLYFAHARFNTPLHNRSSTTRARFQLAQAAYVISAVALFAVLSMVLAKSPGLLGALHAAGQAPEFLNGLSSPLLAALVMTTLLPQFPGLTQIDSGLLKYFQDMGSIPSAVKQLSGKLAQRPLAIDDEARARMAELLVERDHQGGGVACEDLTTDPAHPTSYAFTRMLLLHVRLKALQLEPRYGRFLTHHREQLDQAEESVDEILAIADRFFPVSRNYDGKANSKALTQTLKEFKKSFRQQIAAANAQLAELVARAILLCERTEADRRRRLAWLGLPEHEAATQILPPNRVVAVLSMVFLALFLGITLLARIDPYSQIPAERAFMLALMVATVYGVAIMGAILPKHRWRFAMPGPQGRPFAAYALSGIVAVIGASAVMLVFKTVMLFDVDKALDDFAISYPWLGMTFTAAVLLAWLCDDYFGRVPPHWLRWAEGVAAAATLTTAAWIVHGEISVLRLRAGLPVLGLARVLLISLAVGFILGFCVPHWYRKARSAGAVPEERGYAQPKPPAAAPAVP